jgi:predicted transcriptional regulator
MNLDLPVHHVMTSLPRTLRIDETLTDAWTWMLNGGFHHLPVTNEGQLVGMLSASDLRAVLRDLPDEIYDTGVILDDSRTVETLMTSTDLLRFVIGG